MDGKEINDDIQVVIKGFWDQVNQDNFYELSDYVGYYYEFLCLFGFDVVGVDYDVDVDLLVNW